jgi:hypothetical protein
MNMGMLLGKNISAKNACIDGLAFRNEGGGEVLTAA